MPRRYNHERYVEQTAMAKMFVTAIRESAVSQSEISKRTGLARTYISELLNGRTHGSLPTWQSLLDAAEIELGSRQKVRG